MKVNDPGHVYELDLFENSGKGQVKDVHLHFIKKEQSDSGEFETVHDGTTNEEVLRVLIDRMKYLQDKMACKENAIVITNLEESLMWLNKRTEDRKNRNVEGTHKE